MVADKEYDVECEIDCQAYTKNEDAMTKQRVYVDQDPTKIPDDEGNIKPSSTKRKKHKKKKKKPVTMNSTCELGDDEDVKESVVVVLSNDNDRSCMTTTSTTTSITTTSTRTPSKKPIIVQRGLLSTGFTKDYIKYGQTDPPTIPVAKLFQQQQNIPCGEYQYDTDRMHYYYQTKFVNGGRSYRITPKEAAMLSQCDTTTTTSVASTTELDIMNDVYQKLRLGGEIHRQVRNFTQSIIQPGIELSDMCTQLENMNRLLTQEAGIQRGIAFPTGCSINHVAAHYTPNTGDRTVLQYNDVMKVDFGVQIDGYIIDSAWTVAFNERYDPLLQAVKEATEMGIVTAGIDQRLCDIGANIQEVMESYEIELQNHIYPIRAIRNLGGHSINRYQIHGAKSVPIVKNGCDESIVMDEYELYAIETFGSTGRGYVIEDMECSHYMKRFDAPYIPLRMTSSKKLLHHIDKTFGTLAFCRRWLDRKDGGSAYVHGTAGGGQQVKYMGALKNLCDVGIIQPIPPLCDVHGCYTAQYEHTFMIQPNGKKEIFSRGTDY